ncbi:MAG: Imm27 family immunity protein [Tepidisphaeraceae bacterium]|jgi:hypothetical protein
MRLLEPNESVLEGRWIKAGGGVVADDTSRRIEELISAQLTRLAASEDGWDILYVDKRDGRMWELTYPHKDWHGGGPPLLTNVAKDLAERKYRLR